MIQKSGESFLRFCERATQDLIDNKISYEEWSKAVTGGVLYGSENLRRCSLFFRQFLEGLSEQEEIELSTDDRIEELKELKRELEIERKKLQNENREYQANIRHEARVDFLNEKILEAIHNLSPITFPEIPSGAPVVNESAVLVVSDLHYDSNYELKGLYGEIVNKYDKGICKARMNMLADKIGKETDFVYDDLLVVFNGDLIENVLRMSSLTKLRDPVVDSVIELGEFLANWLVKMQEEVQVPLKVAVVGGNHSVIRALGSRPIDERENLEKIIHKFIELRLENAPTITVEPYTDAYFTVVKDNSLLFVHGEDSDLAATMEYYENYYNVCIDYIVAGHYHRGETKTVGVGQLADREVIRVPSICGTDSYAKRLRKNARAGAMFMLFSEEGRTWARNFCLN